MGLRAMPDATVMKKPNTHTGNQNPAAQIIAYLSRHWPVMTDAATTATTTTTTTTTTAAAAAAAAAAIITVLRNIWTFHTHTSLSSCMLFTYPPLG